ncbi:hypothetical protein P9112_004906 [Eukaryota sp. TZLM1-RC]
MSEDLRDLWAAAVTHIFVNSEEVKLRPSNTSQISLPPNCLKKNNARVWYGITAWNPMGQEAPKDQNIERNIRLRDHIASLTNPPPASINFAYSEDPRGGWKEEGFCVAFTHDVDDIMVSLGSKFQQGAIYKYVETENGFLQTVIPCFEEMHNTESDVYMEFF